MHELEKDLKGELPEFTHKGGDPARHAILESNHRMREGLDEGAINFGTDGGFGRVSLRIPLFDYPFICVMFPDLKAPDSHVRHKAWQAFTKSPLSEPYRVGKKIRRGAR